MRRAGRPARTGWRRVQPSVSRRRADRFTGFAARPVRPPPRRRASGPGSPGRRRRGSSPSGRARSCRTCPRPPSGRARTSGRSPPTRHRRSRSGVCRMGRPSSRGGRTAGRAGRSGTVASSSALRGPFFEGHHPWLSNLVVQGAEDRERQERTDHADEDEHGSSAISAPQSGMTNEVAVWRAEFQNSLSCSTMVTGEI